MGGKLIVIDGADGSGKATQTRLLIKALKKQGKAVEMLDFPRYDKASSYFVKEYLNGRYGAADEVSPKLASLFYALDRFDAKKDIKKVLDKGKIIISNRYVSASIGHQGGKISDLKKRNEFIEWLYDLEYNICGLPKPDLTIYLNVPAEIGQKLVDKKGHRDYVGGSKRDIHEKDKNHLINTQKSFLYIVNKEKKSWIKIDCIENKKLLSIDKIHQKVLKEILKKI